MAKIGADLCFSKLLLPAPTWYETVWSALRGVVSVAMNLEDRDALESMIQKGIIQDQVLQNSRHHSKVSPGGTGSVLTFSLFNELHHNPLWQKYKFDPQEFCHAVGPALTNFHDLVFQLQNEEGDKFEKMLESAEGVDDRQTNDNSNESSNNKQLFRTETLNTIMELAMLRNNESESSEATGAPFLIKNPWEQDALENPDSLAAAVVPMVTPACLQRIFEATIAEVRFRKNKHLPPPSVLGISNQSTDGDGDNEPFLSFSTTYVKGSAKIGQVAILRARAMEVEVNNNLDDFDENDEFKASRPDFNKPKPVAAQIDVLFEISFNFRESFALSTWAGMVMRNHLGDSWNDDKANKENMRKDELVQYTRLGVAVLEGWLHSAEDDSNKALRWRVPMLRDPVEFQIGGVESVIRTVLSDDGGEVNNKHK